MFYSFRHRRKFQVVYRKRCFQKLGWGQWFPFFVLPHLTRTKEAKKCCYPAGKAFSRDYSTAEKRKNKTALGKKQTNNTVYFSIKELKPQVLRKRVSGLGSVRSVGGTGSPSWRDRARRASPGSSSFAERRFLTSTEQSFAVEAQVNGRECARNISSEALGLQKHAGQRIMQRTASRGACSQR